jgi:hypothetical protein
LKEYKKVSIHVNKKVTMIFVVAFLFVLKGSIKKLILFKIIRENYIAISTLVLGAICKFIFIFI